MPILMASAARTVMTNGDATCATPAASPALMSARRSNFIDRVSSFISVLPYIISAAAIRSVLAIQLSASTDTLMCHGEPKQDCATQLRKIRHQTLLSGIGKDGTSDRLWYKSC